MPYCIFFFPFFQAKLEEFQHQLLNPDENSIDLDQNQISTKTKDIFPDRQGLVTGHRIPLELFSKETIKRLKSVRPSNLSKNDKTVVFGAASL